jgi:hypothetical protein
MQASLMIIAGFSLLGTKSVHTAFRKQIFDQMVGFATSNSAHVRCVSQYFILQFSKLEPGLVGSGVMPLVQYLRDAKDVKKMMAKYQTTAVKL